MCFNRRVLVGLAVAAVAVFAIAGRSGAVALPLLVTLACPLSMVAMLFGMRGNATRGAARHTPSSIADTDPAVIRLRAQLAELRGEPAPTSPSPVDAHRNGITTRR